MDVSSYIGIKFVDGGRDKASGLDCWGLVLAVYADLGVTLRDYAISCFDTLTVSELMESRSGADWIRLDKPEAPCLAAMRFDLKHPTLVNHVGVYVGDNQILQAIEKTGVVLTGIKDIRFASRIEGYYRWNG